MSQTHIYVIKSKERDEFKVGFSADPKQRLASLQTARADELELVYSFPGTVETERELHTLLAEFHIRGEWFTNYEEAKEIIFAVMSEPNDNINEKINNFMIMSSEYFDKEDESKNLFRLTMLVAYQIGRSDAGASTIEPPNKSVLNLIEASRNWFTKT